MMGRTANAWNTIVYMSNARKTMDEENYRDVTHGGSMHRVHDVVVHVWDSPATAATPAPSSTLDG